MVWHFSYLSHHFAQTTAKVRAQVIEDRPSSRETNIAIMTNQDLRITADAVKAMGIPIHIDDYVLASPGCNAWMNDRVRCYESIGSVAGSSSRIS